MIKGVQRTIDREKVRYRYNEIQKIWDERDLWHEYTRQNIEDFLKEHFGRISQEKSLRILNAGSAGNDYGLTQHSQIHVDIAESKIRGIPNSIVSSIEEIPLEDNQFDSCLCVGSVINYCDAIKVIQEFARLLNPNGTLILEFETSKSLELLFDSGFRREATIVDTEYQGRLESIWVYSENYIRNCLKSNGFGIISLQRFHILTPIMNKLTENLGFWKFADKLVRVLPVLGKYCANIILVCEKRASKSQ